MAVEKNNEVQISEEEKVEEIQEQPEGLPPEVVVEGEEQIVRSPSIRLEGRGSFDNSQFARGGARLGSHIG